MNNVMFYNGVKLTAMMRSSERRAKEKADLRIKILEAARSLFAKEGYEAVTMREIARKIGYTATALYYHFPDKESLLRELCEADFRALHDYFKRLGRIADPVERLRKTGQAYVHFGLEYPQHYRLMFMTPHPERPSRTRSEAANPGQDAYAFLLQAVREAMAAGCLRPELKDPELAAQALWAGMHGLVALHLTKSDGDWLNWRPPLKTSELLGDMLIRGLVCLTS
jgi:AcrR family transcriptional regulator